MNRGLLILLSIAALCASAFGQEWTAPVRGSWVRAEERAQPGDVVLAAAADGCEIVLGANENSPVRQAAVFLAGDIQKISGYMPAIVSNPSGRRAAIHLSGTNSFERPIDQSDRFPEGGRRPGES